jgi:glutaminyl-peptide cyclotransferase
MTRSAREIITSDGTATLRFRDPKTFKETRHVVVKDGSSPVEQLNELEYVKGEIYANIWHSDRIARISPRDGHVLGWIDLTGLMPASRRINDESVLNGIAYDAQHDRLFVTGKQWPSVFEIKIVPAAKRTGINVTLPLPPAVRCGIMGLKSFQFCSLEVLRMAKYVQRKDLAANMSQHWS